jgi:hypothetical protein
MCRKIAFFLLCFSVQHSFAQDHDKNVVISKATESYAFVRGNKTNPVRVKQELSTRYACNDFRTALPIAEFYNDQVTLDDVEARADGDRLRNLKVVNDFYGSDGIFYSDARVCYFQLPLEKKGSVSEVRFRKTVQDPRYFTNIYFTEPYDVDQKTVTLSVPKWMKIEVKEYNFEGYSIDRNVETDRDGDTYTYTIHHARAFKNEEDAPGPSYLAPHLLILAKYAEPDGERITYFNTLDDQYAWYHKLTGEIGNDPAAIKARAEEITKGLTGDVEKVKAIYQWVQDNIRYIAFEDGLAGFRPEKAQEVLRKKYGDCKGMGNLMAELLKSMGLDGRICWLGTNHIAYDYSTPSLGVDNHMICAWFYKGKTWFLDATEKYIGFGENAERIQGRQVLIESGDKYLLQRIPIADPLQNTSFEKRTLAINGTSLVGKVVQTWKGEGKEWLLTGLHETKKEKQEDALRHFLSGGNANYQITNLKVLNLNNYNDDLKIEYDLMFKDAVTAFDKELYLDVDNRKDFSQFTIDTVKRKLPLQFPYKNHIVFETEIQLPVKAKVGTLPTALQVENPGYLLQGSWTSAPNKIMYRKEIELKKVLLKKDQFVTWNHDVEKLNQFYNNQLTISL